MKKTNTKKQVKDKNDTMLYNLITIANDIAKHFGDKCEVCIHDLKTKDSNHTIVYIENGHITNRKIGDAASNAYLKTRNKIDMGETVENKHCYTTRTKNGKFLKSSTVYLKDNNGNYRYMLCINQDMSALINAKNTIDQLLSNNEQMASDTIQNNVADVLDNLILKTCTFIGKVPNEMTKEEKKLAIKNLNEQGAFLITGSGDEISKCFGISKYTMYSYIKQKSRDKE